MATDEIVAIGMVLVLMIFAVVSGAMLGAWLTHRKYTRQSPIPFAVPDEVESVDLDVDDLPKVQTLYKGL